MDGNDNGDIYSWGLAVGMSFSPPFFRIGAPCRGPITSMTQRLIEGGLIRYWLADVIAKRVREEKREGTTLKSHQVLSLPLGISDVVRYGYCSYCVMFISIALVLISSFISLVYFVVRCFMREKGRKAARGTKQRLGWFNLNKLFSILVFTRLFLIHFFIQSSCYTLLIILIHHFRSNQSFQYSCWCLAYLLACMAYHSSF